MNKYKRALIVIGTALLIKFFLFGLILFHAPESRFQNDSRDYLETAQGLSTRLAFAKVSEDGSLNYEFYRTPGYPVFLAIFMAGLKLSINGVILTQILMTLLAAWITYMAALRIESKIAFLSALIVLYDPPVSIFSLQILSETLSLLVLSLFMLSFISYLKHRRLKMIALSALLLTAATYVRPTTYYLGWIVAIFVIYANLVIPAECGCFVPAALAMAKKAVRAMVHALVFLVIIYGLLGLWQERNLKRCGLKSFCNVVLDGYRHFGLYKSYPRNKDREAKGLTPVAYYTKTTLRSFLSLMTRPGPFKYFKSRMLSALGNVFAYPWMVFWLIGFVIGLIKCGRNIYYQFILLIIVYFIAASVGGVSVLVGERFRVSMVPFIAIISAYGWSKLRNDQKYFSNT